MGTNFYLRCEAKKTKAIDLILDDKFDEAIKVLDTIDIHIAKRSCGWLPLFQAHKDKFSSILELEQYVKTTPDVYIIDEYDTVLTWDKFMEEVVSWNGGTAENAQRLGVPAHSHLTDIDAYYRACYSDFYFTDPEGYEFTYEEFC